MVKVKAISRDKRDFAPGALAPSELTRVSRSSQPELHPFEKGREYVRAVNAVKLDKHFSKPFVGALSGHMDGVQCLAKSPAAISTLVSGGCDGEIIRWNLTEREAAWRVQAHSGFVRGLAFSRAGHHFVSASDDRTVKLWSAAPAAADDADAATKPLATFLGRHAFTDVDHHRREHSFATGGPTLLLWDTARSDPVQSFEWGADSITRVRFNPAEHSLIAALSNDRSATLFDLRTGSAMQKSARTPCTRAP
jgi:WD repeat and SOF domain-containing protein 1